MRLSTPCVVSLLFAAILAFGRFASGQTQLVNGVPLAGLGGSAGNEKLFVIAVPPNASSVSVETLGNDPDADIYVSWGTPPTPNACHAKSDGPSSDEWIQLLNPPGGNLYILVRAHSSYGGLAIVAQHNGSGDLIDLENGESESGLFGFTGDHQYFRISIPSYQSYAKVTLTGSDPDADLYVRWGNLPTTQQYTAKSTTSSSNESIQINNPQSGDLYILVHAYSGYFNATLSVEWNGPSGSDEPIELSNGQTYGSFGGAKNSLRLFAIDIPNGTPTATFSISGGSGDADLYVRWDAPPTLSVWDERPYLEGNNESVTITNPEGGTVYLLVHGYMAYGGVKIKASFQGWKHYTHKAGPWKDQKIGTSQTKIKDGGSLLASLSMALDHAGADVDPGALNAFLKSNAGYNNGSTVKLHVAAKYDGPDGLDYLGSSTLTTPAAMRAAIDAGKVIIVRSSRFGTSNHWVVVRTYVGNGTSWSNFRYLDPADASPGTSRSMSDGWIASGATTRVFQISN